MKTKIKIYGLCRDSEPHLQRTLKQLESLVQKTEFDFSFCFYENDSIDNTRLILDSWIKNYNGNIICETLNAKKFGSVPDIERLILLSYYRNKLISEAQNDDSDLSLLIDTDLVFDNLSFDRLIETINANKCVAVVANARQNLIPDLMFNETNDSFYDVFAFRDKFNNYGLYFTDCPFVLEQDRISWANKEPIKIQSGFSGFMLIKTQILKLCLWSTCGSSEHVNFCYNINRYGDILLCPNAKVYTDIDLSTISIEACKNIAQQQKQRMSQINQIYDLSISKKLTDSGVY